MAPLHARACLVVCLLATVLGEDYHYTYEGEEEEGEGGYEWEEYEEEGHPVFLDVARDFTVDVGASITFPCAAVTTSHVITFSHQPPRPGSRTVYYYAADTRVRKSPRLRKVGSSFVLSSIRRSDAGRYTCRIETREPVELSHSLIVRYAPKVSLEGPAQRWVLQGAVTSLRCTADGQPPPAITWTKLAAPAPRLHKGASLVLTQVDSESAGVYQCEATNGVGSPATARVELMVEYPPSVTVTQAWVHAGEGSDAVLECSVTGNPTPSVTWGRNTRSHHHSQRYQLHDQRIESSGKHTVRQWPASHRYSLAVLAVSEDDFGEYSCHASNNHGSSSGVITLTGLPSVPQMSGGPGGEPSQYTLAWVTHSPAPVLLYRVKYRPYSKSHSTIEGPGHWFDSLYSPPATDEGNAGSNDGASADSDAHPTTGSNVRAPGNVRQAGHSPSQPAVRRLSLQMSWTSASPRGGGGDLKAMSHLLSHLSPHTEYEALVQVENRHGWSQPSDPFRFATSPEPSATQSASTSTAAPSLDSWLRRCVLLLLSLLLILLH